MSVPNDAQRPPSPTYGAASSPQRIRPVADMEKIVSLCKRRGFIFQSSEIYGGLNGAWDYGPLGVELKRNLKNYWWRVMVHERDDVVGMDGAILTHPEVLKASGHVEGFSDPMIDCRTCKAHLRADQLVEKKDVKQCPNCGGKDFTNTWCIYCYWFFHKHMFSLFHSFLKMGRSESWRRHQKYNVCQCNCFLITIETNKSAFYRYIYFLFKFIRKHFITVVHTILESISHGY